MKIYYLFIFAAVLLSGCKKDVAEQTAPAEVPVPLSAHFSMSANEVGENTAVTCTPDQVNSNYTYSWSISYANNKQVLTDKTNPSITYRMHGIYQIRLVIKNNKGEQASCTRDLTILCNIIGDGEHPEVRPEVR